MRTLRLLAPLVSSSSSRKFGSTGISPEKLRAIYANAKKTVDGCVREIPKVDPRGVFVNNDLNLFKIDVYGFDYDYTLAIYKKELNELIYRLAVQRLIKDFHYPDGLLIVPYDLYFAIRGLHYDIQNCTLLKVDAFSQIQKGTVHRGHKELSDQELIDIYGGITLPDDKGRNMPQLIDLFSLPWASLLANTIQYFDDNKIHFDPHSMYHDIAECVKQVHVSGEMYANVSTGLNDYVHRNPGLGEYLARLVDKGKQLFMVTNSPFSFMNAGMTFMLGEKWRQLFKHIVVEARKPSFFQSNTPFRLYNEVTGKLHYKKIMDLVPGDIYAGGNINDLSKKARFEGKGVLYFGDHIYTDLADPMLRLGWHTAAIVPELEREIFVQNGDDYRKKIQWIELLTNLIERFQSDGRKNAECYAIVNEWADERRELRVEVKQVFNPRFGSLFRTYHNMTFFSRRLSRLSDIYTSRLPNLLDYDVDHSFFPRRNALPHENLNSVPIMSETTLVEIEQNVDKGQN